MAVAKRNVLNEGRRVHLSVSMKISIYTAVRDDMRVSRLAMNVFLQDS